MIYIITYHTHGTDMYLMRVITNPGGTTILSWTTCKDDAQLFFSYKDAITITSLVSGAFIDKK